MFTMPHLPSGLKLESETAVTYNEDFEADGSLRPNEQAVLDAFTGVFETDGFRIGKENQGYECRTCCRLPDG